MDLLIVVHPHDVPWVRYTLHTNQRMLRPVRTYLMTYSTDEVAALFPECTVVSLGRLPFTYDDVVKATSAPHAWTYLVQLARLYASDVLVLDRPFVCLDADAVVLQPLRLDAVGTRHGTNPYVFAHLHALHPALRKELPQSADVPYYVVEPLRLQALHVTISEANTHTPFWRLYLSAIPPHTQGQGASDKELYVTWGAHTQRPTCVSVVWKRITSYADVTPLLADAKGVQLVTCPAASQSLLTCFQTSPWTRVQRWLGDIPLATLPVPLAAIADRTPGTVVHFGCGEMPSLDPWTGWTYQGVDVSEEAVHHALTRFPALSVTCLDVCVAPLPSGTLAVCTEFLPRLGYTHALTFLLRLRRVYPVVLFVDYVPHGTPRINVDHPTGDQGVIWWDLPPYNVWGVTEHGRVPLDGGTLVVHVLETPSQP